MSTQILSIDIADDPASWARLGFTVAGEDVHLAGLRLRLTGRGQPHSNGSDSNGSTPRGIRAWSLAPQPPTPIDGLAVVDPPDAIDPDFLPPSATRHRNTATALDHLVIGTQDLDATTAAFATQGWVSRQTLAQPDQDRTLRFFVVAAGDGRTVLEVMEPRGPQPAQRSARFWGLAVTVADIDRAHRVLGGDVLGTPTDAFQPGRRIATVRGDAIGISVPLAFISPRT